MPAFRRTQSLIFVAILVSVAAATDVPLFQRAVDYSKAVEWQRRTLYCAPSPDGVNSGVCYLTRGPVERNTPESARCREEHFFDNNKGMMERRSICNIECRKADRDSVISKMPNGNRQCVRYYTYNTQQTMENEWYIWRSANCRLVEISLEVHCGFL